MDYENGRSPAMWKVLNKSTMSGNMLTGIGGCMSTRTQRFGWIATAIAGIAVGSSFAPTADAALIVDQQPTADIGLQSTLYTLTATASVEEIDSFTTATAYRLGTLTAFTSSDGLGPAISVSGSIYSGAPPGDPGAQLVTTASGTLDASHDIVVDFGDALLPVGSYYLTAFVVRQSSTTAFGIGTRPSRVRRR